MHLLGPARRCGKLLIRDGRGHRLLPVERIHVFVDYALAELEDRLASGFTRANWSDLVSITHVEKSVMEGDGSARLLLATGAEVRISRRRTGEVKRRFEQLLCIGRSCALQGLSRTGRNPVPTCTIASS